MLNKSHIAAIFIGFFLVGISGCNEGGSSNTNGSINGSNSDGNMKPVEGTVITSDEAYQLIINKGTGLWRLDFKYDDFYEYNIGFGLLERIEGISNLRTTLLVRDDPQEVELCGGLIEPLTLESDFIEKFGSTSHSCTQYSTTFKRTESEGVGYEHYCDENIVVEGTLEKISNATDFDFGALTVNTIDLSANINSSDKICGSISSYDYVITTLESESGDVSIGPESEKQWDIDMTAPYENGLINMYLNFTGDQTTGIYPHSGDEVEDYSKPHATIWLSPAEADEIPLTANGTVTVTGVTAYSVSGSFDLVTKTDTDLDGSFSLDFR